jgi:hypothetical protein
MAIRFPTFIKFVFSLLLVLGMVSSLTSTALAQSLPSDLKFICGPANSATKTSKCIFQVPADLIGASFNIEVPKLKVSQIKNLKKGDNTSLSSIFFQLEATDAGSNVLFQIDFADVKAVANGTTPFALFQFDLVLFSALTSDFPLVIPAPLKTGSQLYTPTSLALNQASFTAAADTPLEIRIGGLEDGGTGTPGTINSSFKYSAGSTGGGGGGGAGTGPGFYCFDDPVDSMTDAEWTIICDAKNRGIISGNPRDNGTFFFPNQPINRAEAAKIVTLGILRILGKLTIVDFNDQEEIISAGFPAKRFITYPDIVYEESGLPPWFAVYVTIATQQKIVGGYPHDGTYKAVNKINNAESYRVIVETGRVASEAIADALEVATRRSSLRTEDWFLKYSNTLDQYKIKFSKEYEKFTTRKDFLIIVMDLLKAVGL